MVAAGYKQTEIGVIPEDWEVSKLGELGSFKNGINKGADDFGFGSPFINLMDVFGKNIIASNKDFGLINSNSVEKEVYNVKEGDVIFIRSSVKPSGVGKTIVIDKDLDNTVYSGFLIRYRNTTLIKSFKRFCFDSNYFRNSIIAASTVSANTNVNQESLKGLYLLYPKSLPEQKAIAAALSDADMFIESLEKLIAKKQLIKQGAMQQLLTPKEGWEVKRLGEMAEVATGTTPPTADLHNYGNEYCFVSPSDLGNIKYITKTEKNLSKKGFKLSRKFPKNSILFTCIGSTIGKSGIASIELTSNQQINAIFPSNSFSSEFVFYSLNLMSERIRLSASEQALPMINKTEFEKIAIYLPSVNEQTRIATILSDMDSELEALDQQLAKAHQIKQGMMQELLTGRVRLV